MLDRLLDRVLRDLVERDPLHGLLRHLIELQRRDQVPGDRLAFAVRVGREIDGFGALGLGGLFYEKKQGMIKGYIAGVIGRYFFAILSGVVFFAYYAPEGTSPLVYSITYNATYIVPEFILTIIVLSIPVIKSTLKRIKLEANEKDIRKTVQLG